MQLVEDSLASVIFRISRHSMRPLFPTWTLCCAAALLLAACGQRAPLVHPDQAPPPAKHAAKTASPPGSQPAP
ncbi:LPS translocon maturation chaperone LptM [Ideonella benzenivorans]|uniref:LPS translocon maturation chaperone LptM n=1 Tax=Ideonella benzenivorans TaxID=2831643 RepID=UPI0035C24DAA